MLCFLGKSIQLPLYTYAILNNPSLVKYISDETPSFSGFGIQHVYPSSFKAAFADNGDTMKSFAVIGYLKTKGCISDDVGYLTSLNTELVQKRERRMVKRQSRLRIPRLSLTLRWYRITMEATLFIRVEVTVSIIIL